MVVVVVVQPPSTPPWVDPSKWDIARFHGTSYHSPNFSPIAIKGKGLFFDPLKQVVGITGKMKNGWC